MDQILKLQPHRTMHLQGFDAYGAAAALWGASETGFNVSGVFRDQGDFAVLVLFQKDDPFGHPRFSYLPGGNFTGLTLAFDIQWQGIQAFESKKSPWTDWAYLNCLDGNGIEHQVLLSTLATGPGGRTGAAGVFTLNSGTIAPGDRVTLWYQNKAYDYTVPSFTPSCVQAMWWQGNATYTHSVTIGSHTYGVQEGSLNSAQIATAVANLINASDPNCTATTGGAYGNEITVALKTDVAGPVLVFSSDGSASVTLTAVWPSTVCANIAAQINATDFAVTFGPVVLSAIASGNQITITAEPGADGNMVTFYELHKNTNLYFTPATVQLAGGSSDNVSWHIGIDSSALGWIDLQKLWLTFAPALANGAAYASTEWSVTATNWSVTDPGGVRPLKVAGPGSVRIEEDNPWITRYGYWEPAPTDGFAFWSMGRAIRAAASGSSVTIETHCQSTHDILVGTLLDVNCGMVQVSLDGGTPINVDCYAATRTTVRKKLFGAVAAGQHSIVITISGSKNSASSGSYFYLDFLECAVRSDVPDAPATSTSDAVSTDYDTDATYKLPPQRLIWAIQKLGLVGEIDHYCGVFWWKQSVAVGGNYPSVTVTFGGTWADQDVVWLNFGGTLSGGVITGGTSIGKTVFPCDTASTIAAHFACFINEKLVGVWASASGPALTITTRSNGAIWMYSFLTQTNSALGTITVPGATTSTSGGQSFTSSTALETGAADPIWTIDPTAGQVFNRAFRDWHADYFAALHAAGLGVVVSFSQELVNPPDNPGGGAVWVQRYPDNTPVATATGFGTLYSSQAAFGAPVEGYMQSAHRAMAALLSAAGLPVRLQFGEVLWWFQANASGMAFYDADTQAAAQTALGRALATFHTPNDDPSANSYADANFLRARLKAYVDAIRTYVLASYPAAAFELLWPMDVNDPDTCQLTRYINLPAEWQTPAGSGFDTFMSEGFQYGGINHNLDQANRCAAYPFAELSWDKAHCRYLMGWYYSGWPWQREYFAAQRTGVPTIKFWAYDHLCLFGWPLPLPRESSQAAFL